MKHIERFDSWASATDYLAYERTTLAGERTMLAYCRTAVALFVSGVGLVKLLDYSFLPWLGTGMMLVSPLVLIYGVAGYIRFRVCLRQNTAQMEKEILLRKSKEKTE